MQHINLLNRKSGTAFMCKYGTNKDVFLMKVKPFSGRREIPVDACIAPLVQVLNDYGIETIACCCGHGKTAKSGIRISSKNVRLSQLEDDFSVGLEFLYIGKKDEDKT